MNEAQLVADMRRAVDDVFAPNDLLERAVQAHRRRRAVAGGVGSVVAVVALTLSVAYLLPHEDLSSLAGQSAAALRHPAASGVRLDPGVPRPGDKYWHVVSFDAANGPKSPTLEQWTDAAGHIYVSPIENDRAWKSCTCGGFEISGVATIVSYAQIAALPTDPAALRRYLGERWDTLPGKPTVHTDADERIIGVDGALTSLLADVPAPRAVRKAAFEALAQSPHRVEAPHPDTTVVLTGYKLSSSKAGTDQPPAADRHTVVVDPSTGQLAKEISYRDGTTIIRKAEWVARLP